MLQHDRQLKVIANNIEKKVKSELVKLMKDDREKYEKFWAAFGNQIKYGVVAEYGAHKEMLQDLLLFWSSKEGKNTTLAAYKDRMPEDQPYYYYACGESVDKIAKLPQVERILDKGYEILYCTEDVDDFVMQALGEIDGKKFKSATAEDALPQTEEEKKAAEEKAEAGKDVLEIYYNPPYTNGGIEKASANLIAFDKTDMLEPGASQTLTISFDVEDMASYDTCLLYTSDAADEL